MTPDSIAIESGVPLPVHRRHGYSKPSAYRDVAARMRVGDSIVVPARDAMRAAMQISCTGAGYTYQQVPDSSLTRVWKTTRHEA